MIIKAYLRGLLKDSDKVYGLRSKARKELILLSLAYEEDYEVSSLYANLVTNLYSNHIQNTDYLKEFAQRQLDITKYAADCHLLKKYVHKSKPTDSQILGESSTQKLINRFLYMKREGILLKIIDEVFTK